ncbi:uncharacterized protein [Heptranchias perlo]|uniref:uncharacterized protein isoform X3 n=1 Tax=Heptranchias perlo TaxID=212740 RepID=UPI003559A143
MWVRPFVIVAVFVTACTSQTPDQCHHPPTVTFAELKNEFITLQDFIVGDIISYRCLSGYIWNKSTPDFIICQSNLTWSEPLIGCIPKDCGDPTDIQNGYYRVTGRSIGHKANYYCNKGYELFGKNDALCTNNGWSKKVPQCEIISCGSPDPISNGYVSQRNEWTYGMVANYSCDAGYTLTGQHNINCTHTGSWSHDSPVCKALPDREEQLPDPSNSTISPIREPTPQTSYITTDDGDRNHLLSSLPGSFLDLEEQLPAPSTNSTIVKIREPTPQTSYITTDDGDRNHLLSSLLGYTTEYGERRTGPSMTTTVNTIINKTISLTSSPSPTNSFNRSLMLSAPLIPFLDLEEQLPAPSTNSTIVKIREPTPQTSYITTDDGDRNHLLSSLLGYTTEYGERRTGPSMTTTVNTIINKTISLTSSPSPTNSFNRSLMLSAPLIHTTEYGERRISPSMTTTVNTIINKTISLTSSPNPTNSFNRSLMLSPPLILAVSSNENWTYWLYGGVIPGAILGAGLAIIKVLTDRRKYGKSSFAHQPSYVWRVVLIRSPQRRLESFLPFQGFLVHV